MSLWRRIAVGACAPPRLPRPRTLRSGLSSDGHSHDHGSRTADGPGGALAHPWSLEDLPPMPRIMHPDWYRTPMAEDDPRMIGDYPDVPAQSYQLRDPHQRYFDQQNRRDFGEALPEDYEPLLMWSFDVEERYGAGWVAAAMGGLLGGYYLFYQWLGRTPSPFADRRAPRELPTVGEYYGTGKVPHRMLAD